MPFESTVEAIGCRLSLVHRILDELRTSRVFRSAFVRRVLCDAVRLSRDYTRASRVTFTTK